MDCHLEGKLSKLRQQLGFTVTILLSVFPITLTFCTMVKIH